ncbi:hypothetical protein [Sphingopyxis sp. KK2]|uniref:hypothetical protein n=1 Tax=Sphingopyxis sp. KK2 TaxID=1855727 RepID=UPI00097E5929|nr:hypothetical protein [Sphingopyxis sp. KK2]
MDRLLTFARRSAIAQLAGCTLMAAIETGLFGLALLVTIIWSGESGMPPFDIGAIVESFLFLWLPLVLTLPIALMIAITILWPVASMSAALLLLGARYDRRFASQSLWIIVGTAVGLACGLLIFFDGEPRFDIVEGPLAPVATLAWTGATGAFAGWRQHGKLNRSGRFGDATASS